MRHELTVAFGADGEVNAALGPDETPWAADIARRWLDDQFMANDCEPLRASGKVLTADKVLALAGALGYRRLASDERLRNDFALATLGALGRPLVHVDVEGGAITF